jgi:hypothetical protein
MQDYDKCVAAGEAWLESNAPHGFKDRLVLAVQRDEFDLASVSRCVLAHSFPDDIDGDIIPGHYTSIILERFECHLNQVEALGFAWDTYADLKPLQAAWERRIARWQEDQRKAELQRAVLRSNHEMPGRWVS